MNRIPHIPADELMKLARRIKFGAFVHGVPTRIRLELNKHNVLSLAFTFEPDYAETMPIHPMRRHILITFHRFGAPSFFKPSVAEVLSQIPAELIDDVDGFVIEAENMSSYNCLPDGYHFTRTHLLLK